MSAETDRRDIGASAPAGRLWTVWVTSLEHGVDHAVTDEEMAAAMADGREFATVCGTTMLPAPMVCASRPPCPRCVLFLRARAQLRDLAARMACPRHRRPTLVARLLHRVAGVRRG